MKKILFVLRSARSGGSVTSMLNLLSLLKEKGYVIDLFLFERDGCFLERAEQVANVLPEESIISSIMYTKNKLKKKGIKGLIIRTIFVFCHIIFGVEKTYEYFYRLSSKKLSNKYDLVVAYQESETTDYVQYIKAKKKIAWVHNDFSRFTIGKTKEKMQNIYNQFNEVICVSMAAKNSMLENLKLQSTNVHLIYNTILKDYIIDKSKENVEFLLRRSFTFISMGRFVLQKGFDRAVSVAYKMKKEKINFIWYIIGEGENKEKIEQEIKERKLEEHLILLGLKANPFPYINQADCFIMTSRYEAQPMVLNEALTLGIPVISTHFSSVNEVIQDGINGLIVENSEEGIYNGIINFIDNKDMKKKIENGAKNFVYNNEKIMEDIQALFKL